MDILGCLIKLGYKAEVWDNSYDGIRPHELETRPIPSIAELEAVWPEVELVEREAQKRGAYRTEADPLYAEWQALLAAGHPDAEVRNQEWLAKKAEIAARFP